MIVAKETVWARCREEVNTLLDLLPPGLRSGPTTSEPDRAQRRTLLRNSRWTLSVTRQFHHWQGQPHRLQRERFMDTGSVVFRLVSLRNNLRIHA